MAIGTPADVREASEVSYEYSYSTACLLPESIDSLNKCF